MKQCDKIFIIHLLWPPTLTRINYFENFCGFAKLFSFIIDSARSRDSAESKPNALFRTKRIEGRYLIITFLQHTYKTMSLLENCELFIIICYNICTMQHTIYNLRYNILRLVYHEIFDI